MDNIIGMHPAKMSLIMVMKPIDEIDMKDAVEEMQDLKNPIIAVQGREITAVHTVDHIVLDHSEAAENELVWSCEGCKAYSRSKYITENHELNCPDFLALQNQEKA